VHYFVPAEFGNSSVVYRTDLVDPEYIETNSWSIMYDDRYAGRLAWLDSGSATVEVAALVKGFDDIFSLNDEQLEAVRPLMAKQRDLTRFYWTDVTELERAIASGEVVAAYAWNQSYTSLLSEGVPVGYMVPKEGILAWGSGFVIHKDAKDLDAVYAYIDAWTSPESGAWLIDNYGYGSANLKAYDLVSPERRAELGYENPEALIASTKFLEALAPEMQEKYEALYNEVRAGA
jgi:spermidine/putrescine-binding protein